MSKTGTSTVELNNSACSLMHSNANLKEAIKCLECALTSFNKELSSSSGSSGGIQQPTQHKTPMKQEGRSTGVKETVQHDSTSITCSPNHPKVHYDEGMSPYSEPILIHSQWNGANAIEATVTFNIGLAHAKLNDDDAALTWFLQAIRLISSSKSPQIQNDAIQGHIILHNVGHVHWRAGRYKLAMSIYGQALEFLSGTLLHFVRQQEQEQCQQRKILLQQQIKALKLDISSTLNCLAVSRLYSNDEELFPTSETLLLLRKALRLHGESTGKDPANCPCKETATIMNNMGRAMFNSGNFTAALSVYKMTHSCRASLFGEHHLDVAITLYNIAETNSKLGNIEEAIECYNKFLSIASNILSPGHEDIKNTLMSVGRLYLDLEEWSNATDIFTMALRSARLKSVETNQYEISFILNQLGNAAFGAGSTDQALEFYKEGLSIERTLKDSQLLTVTLTNIANIATLQEDYNLAVSSLEEAVAFLEGGDGEGIDDRDEKRANILSNIASIYEHQGNLSLAAKGLKRSIDIRRTLPGTNKQMYDLSSGLNSLGLVQFKQGRASNALDSFIEALGIRWSVSESNLQAVSTVANNVAVAYQHMGELEQALFYFKETLNLSRKAIKACPDCCAPENILDSFHKIASIYKRQQKFQSALEYYEEAHAFCVDEYCGTTPINEADLFKIIAEVHNIKQCLATLRNVDRDCAPAA